jgi:vesicle-fusing ATPase
MGKESGFPLVKCLLPEDFIGMGEGTKCERLRKAFHDAYRSELSMIVMDDIERFIDFAPVGSRFSNSILQAILVLFKTLPQKGKRLMIIGTTSRIDVLQELGILESVDHVFNVPSLNTGQEVCAVLTELMNWNRPTINEILRRWKGTIEIKRLISLAEMATQAYDPNTGENLADIFLKLFESGMMRRS